MPRSTSPEKIALIEFQGGRCHLVDDPGTIYDESRRLADETGGHYMDQFTYAERATDWRGNNNIAESIFTQLAEERFPIPTWVVVGAGTGGTSATIGRYVRYRRLRHPALRRRPGELGASSRAGRPTTPRPPARGSRIEGIGRPRVEPSFLPSVVDCMIAVPDAASIAAGALVHDRHRAGRSAARPAPRCGARCAWSPGCVTRGPVRVAWSRCCATAASATPHTYYADDWLAAQGIDIAPYLRTLEKFADTGALARADRLTAFSTRTCCQPGSPGIRAHAVPNAERSLRTASREHQTVPKPALASQRRILPECQRSLPSSWRRTRDSSWPRTWRAAGHGRGTPRRAPPTTSRKIRKPMSRVRRRRSVSTCAPRCRFLRDEGEFCGQRTQQGHERPRTKLGDPGLRRAPGSRAGPCAPPRTVRHRGEAPARGTPARAAPTTSSPTRRPRARPRLRHQQDVEVAGALVAQQHRERALAGDPVGGDVAQVVGHQDRAGQRADPDAGVQRGEHPTTRSGRTSCRSPPPGRRTRRPSPRRAPR